jgi:predicted regulator of Ras-like GTPase activity (Roadblock/LC7/MglB family)
MTIPFLDLFKKITSRFGSTSTEEAPAEPVIPVRAPKKPASERLSKTVLPHTTTRMSAPSDPFRNSGPAVAGRSFGSPMQLGPERITSAPKKAQATSPLPPALAKALEPKLERTISLQITDLIDRVPAGYIKPVEILDSAMRVSLKASEIEKGMPEKNPTVALPSLYQQVPEIFLKGVRPDDETRVALPYEKVLDQFQSAHVRDDQVRDPAVPQVDTPILKATIQDSEKFGTKIEPIEAASLPSVPVKHATAESIAAAEPDAIVQSKAKLSISNRPAVSLYAPDVKPKSEPPQSPSRTGGPSRTGSIPFNLSPNGTGGSASERVPASSGPPVPTPLPFTPELAKIAFGAPAEKPAEKPKAPEAKKTEVKLEAKPAAKPALKLPETPETNSKQKAESKSKAEPKQKSEAKQTPTPSPAPASDETPIKLSLKAVFKNLPAFQLNGEISAIAEDAQFALPLSLVEPQLAGGRVVVAADVFRDALPENYREMFQADDIGTPVTLPLEEVLKSLPATILKLRDDQEHTAVDKDFETPFSIKAKEDAERLKPAAAPVDKPADKAAEKTDDKKIETAPVAEKKLEPKEVVAEVRALSGVKACAITFSDGLSLAGELPAEKAADGLCAVAPSILERVSQHLRATKLGPLVTATFYTSDSAVSFFARGNLCLTALHGSGSLAPETRTRIAELVEKLSNNYTHPEK